jgi:hypothetical protein
MSRTSVSPGVQRDRRHGRHREMVMRRDKGLCHLCGDPHADAIDHIVPVSWGGSDDPANLAPAHTSCNSSKRDARPEAWTWNRPSMWLDGYGPNTQRRQGLSEDHGGSARPAPVPMRFKHSAKKRVLIGFVLSLIAPFLLYLCFASVAVIFFPGDAGGLWVIAGTLMLTAGLTGLTIFLIREIARQVPVFGEIDAASARALIEKVA